jgi:hypothetical protein
MFTLLFIGVQPRRRHHQRIPSFRRIWNRHNYYVRMRTLSAITARLLPIKTRFLYSSQFTLTVLVTVVRCINPNGRGGYVDLPAPGLCARCNAFVGVHPQRQRQRDIPWQVVACRAEWTQQGLASWPQATSQRMSTISLHLPACDPRKRSQQKAKGELYTIL